MTDAEGNELILGDRVAFPSTGSKLAFGTIFSFREFDVGIKIGNTNQICNYAYKPPFKVVKTFNNPRNES